MNLHIIIPLVFGFAIGMIWPHQSRRIIMIILFGLPCMLLGFVSGYMQAGFVTGYRLYVQYDKKGSQ